VPTHDRRKCPLASDFEISNCTRKRDIQHFELLPATVVPSVVPRARLLLGATYNEVPCRATYARTQEAFGIVKLITVQNHARSTGK